jgi:hypothetical protein
LKRRKYVNIEECLDSSAGPAFLR